MSKPPFAQSNDKLSDKKHETAEESVRLSTPEDKATHLNDASASKEDSIRSELAAAAEELTQTAWNGDENESFYVYLRGEYRRFRTTAWVLGIIGVSIILATLGLNSAGIVQVKVYNLLMSIANLFIVLMAVVIFTRTRPYKRRLKQYIGEPVSDIIDPDAPDGVRIEEHQFADMDDMYKILERKVRTELIPDIPEYHKLRRVWIAVYIAAALIAVLAIVVFYFCPQLNVAATIALLAAFLLVFVAFYIDRTRMRPMRVEWAKQYGMTEMQYRDNMH